MTRPEEPRTSAEMYLEVPMSLVALVRAVILTQGEEDDLLGLRHSLHVVWTEALNTPKELEAYRRLKVSRLAGLV